jgi:hypothetical protein
MVSEHGRATRAEANTDTGSLVTSPPKED